MAVVLLTLAICPTCKRTRASTTAGQPCTTETCWEQGNTYIKANVVSVDD